MMSKKWRTKEIVHYSPMHLDNNGLKQPSLHLVVVQCKKMGKDMNILLEVNKDQTIAPLSAVLVYAIIVTLPPLIFSCVSLCSLGRRSTGVHTNWILAEFICTPQRLIYQALIKEHDVEDAF